MKRFLLLELLLELLLGTTFASARLIPYAVTLSAAMLSTPTTNPTTNPTSNNMKHHDHVHRFRGSLLGVHADVSLDTDTQKASIDLRGIPLGGRLKGTARFSDGEGSDVVVDEPLKSALDRRLVSAGSDAALRLRKASPVYRSTRPDVVSNSANFASSGASLKTLSNHASTKRLKGDTNV